MVIPKKKPNAVVAGVPLSESQIQKGFYISGGVDGILTKLFNLICLDVTGGRGIGPIQWNRLMIDYIQRVSASKMSLDRTSIRGNMNKELRRPGMTWKVFCTKGLVFLKMDCFTFTAHFTTDDDKEFASEITAAFNQDSKYRKSLPVDKYPNPQGRLLKKANGTGVQRGGVVFSPEADGILARLFNTICLDMTDGRGIPELVWNRMLDEYIDKYEVLTESRDKQSVRSGLKKEFRRGRMTWKVFCKGLQFLKIREVTFSVEAVRDDGTRTNVSTSVVFSRKD